MEYVTDCGIYERLDVWRPAKHFLHRRDTTELVRVGFRQDRGLFGH